MHSTPLIALKYYMAMAAKDLPSVASCLAPHVTLISPLGKTIGKEAVVKAAEEFMKVFSTLVIRTHFEASAYQLVVYDLVAPAPIGQIKTASLISIQNRLITEIELFFDARPFTLPGNI